MKIVLKKMISAAILVLLIIFTAGNRVSAQIFTGGDLSATFVNGVNVDIAPIVGYKYKSFSTGLSPVILYTAASTQGFAGDFSYGGRVFAEYDVWKGIFIHAEFKAINTGFVDNSGIKQHGWVLGAPIGGGFEYEIASHTWVKGMVLYDALININLDQNLPNANPTVRGGITYVF